MNLRSPSSWHMRDRVPNRHPFVDYEESFPLALSWQTNVASSVFSQAIAEDHMAYVTTMRDLKALNIDTGEVVWKMVPRKPRSARSGPVLKGTAAVVADLLYFTDDLGDLYALDARSGEISWVKKGLWAENEAICALEDQLFLRSIRTSSGELSESRSRVRGYLCLDIEGRTRWFFQSDDIIATIQPAVQHGILVFGDLSGHVYGVDVSSGEMKWKAQTEPDPKFARAQNFSGAYGAISIVGKRAIMHVGSDQYYACFDVTSGELRWVHHAGALAKNMACNNEQMFYITHDGSFRGVDLETGETVLETDNSTHRLGSSFAHSSLIVGTHLVAGFSGSHKLAVFDTRDGELIWQFEAGGNFNAAPMFVDGKIIIGNDDGHVYCFAGT